jgi:Flp pilus assembly protein TadG
MWLRFVADQRGGVAPMFALAIVPIIGLVGAAIDYSRASTARTAMLATLDSTALMLSRDAADLDQDQITAKATSFFNAQFNRPEVTNVQVTANKTSPQAGSFILNVSASGSVDTTFTRILGTEKLDVGSSTQVKWGIKKLELALVLDNTGSMANNGKMAELKTAAKNLLTTLQTAAKQPGDIKVAIIPFDKIVNIGTGLASSGFIDFSVHNIQQAQWGGCVQDRDQPNDTLDTPPSSTNSATKYPAVNCSAVTPIMTLTDIKDTTGFTNLNNKIDAMNPAGNTNVTIGIVWGWHALTKSDPLTEASDPSPDKEKVIVALTDGDNTQNRWTTSGSSIDARTAAVCANAKGANIKIYTVRVIDGDANLLRNCASKTNMYYEVSQASQLNGVFTSIAQNLANLRLAK